ncbi:MAG TPA: phosphatidate cytidylyltransferase [Gemmatimonadales bacterium]|nr:phosphatidate cytidylyltransferase [Gemmatimonadales bacterium]
MSFAAGAIPVALGIVYWGGWPLALLVAAVGVLGARELFEFAARRGIAPIRPLGYLAAAAMAPLALLAATDDRAAGVLGTYGSHLAAGWILAVLTGCLFARRPTDRPLEAAAVTVLGALYAGALPAFLLGLRHSGYGERSWPGAWLVFFPLVVTWVCDTAAMFAGRAIGGPKLWPGVSPGKTWAGAVAGVLAALLVAPLYDALVFDRSGLEVPRGAALAIAGVLSVVGQIGDLAESLFKREVGLKDSSALIPGHGGVLDRFDSLYFVVPTAAAMYRLIGL